MLYQKKKWIYLATMMAAGNFPMTAEVLCLIDD